MNPYYSKKMTPHFWNSASRPGFRNRRRLSACRGFSLVETALALGVASFALISLLGLLPGGLQTFRKAMDTTLQKEMTQVLIGKANQLSYGDLSSQLPAETYYFDDNGSLVPSTDASATYKANVTVTSAVNFPAATSNYSNNGVALVTLTFSRKQAAASAPPLGTVVTYIAAKTGNSSQ